MKNTLLKTALVLSVGLCAINLHGGGIEKSPKMSFLPDNSEIEFYNKALDFSTSPPPEERKKVMMPAGKKKRLKVKKKKGKKQEGLLFKETKNENASYLFDGVSGIFAAVLLTGGIATFIVGVVLFSLIAWIIALVAVVAGGILAYFFLLWNDFYGGLIVSWLAVAAIGIALFIIGLFFGIISLWVAGIALFALLIIIVLLFFCR